MSFSPSVAISRPLCALLLCLCSGLAAAQNPLSSKESSKEATPGAMSVSAPTIATATPTPTPTSSLTGRQLRLEKMQEKEQRNREATARMVMALRVALAAGGATIAFNQ